MSAWEDAPGKWEDAPKKSARAQIQTDRITQSALNPAAEMSGVERNLAGAGKFFSDIGKGVAQWTPWGSSRKEIDETQDRDVSLMATPGGFLGNLATGAAASVPLSMLTGGSLPGIMGGAGLFGAAQPVGEGDSRTLNTGLSALTAGGMKVGMDKLGGWLGQRATNQATELASEKSRNSMKDATLDEAKKAGYVVPPSAAGNEGFVAKRMESVGGKAAIGQEASSRNQEITNQLAKRSLGLPDDAPITEGTLNALRNKAAAPYREVAKIDQTVAADLEALKVARNEATAYFKHYNQSADPKSLAEARKQQALAERLEGYLEEAATNAGKPQLVQALRDARKLIAKSYDVERALNVATGDVSAPIIGRMLDKGKPLSGELATIGKFAEAFPSYAREGARIPTPGVSKSEALSSALLGIGGAGVAGPFGALAGALPLLSGPARNVSLSKMGQSVMAKPDYTMPWSTQLLSGAANNPMLKRSLPLAAVPSVVGVTE